MAKKTQVSLTTFNSEGRLLQVEYAKKAAMLSNTIISLRLKEGLLVALKNDSKIKGEISFFGTRLFLINKKIGLGGAGFFQDIKIIVKKARTHSKAYKQNYGEEIPVRELVRDLAGFIQEFTQTGGVRPFAAFISILGFEDEGPLLYQIDPSGVFLKSRADSIGRKASQVKRFLQKRKIENLSIKEAFNLIFLAFRKNFEGDENKSNYQFSLVDKFSAFKILGTENIKKYFQ
jgi:20S proteasome subunit alpha 2